MSVDSAQPPRYITVTVCRNALDFFNIIAYNNIVRNSENPKSHYNKGVIILLAEIRGRSQITIPAEIIKSLGISEGDKFDIVEKDGGIFLCPVVVYPKDKILKIAKIIKESETDTKAQKVFDSVEDLFADMGIDV